MQKSHEYSETLRQQIVQEVLSGKITKTEARRVYHIKGKTRILEWIRIYEKYGVCSLNIASKRFSLEVMSKSSESTFPNQPNVQQELQLLKRQLEDERLLKEMYLQMITIAEKEYKIPIRKKPNTK